MYETTNTECPTRTGPDRQTEAVRRLFRRARQRPRVEREAWVRTNAADEEVAEHVLALLAHERGGTDGYVDEVPIGGSLAGWTLHELVGEGGSGRVYRAERSGTVGAFKLLHAKHSGSDGTAGYRLTVERSALERLSHPAIVKLLDSGTIEIGGKARDYLVTEFVEDAEPLYEAAMREGLTLDGRVALLAEIADAVGHAHAQGVVHRDLKPENIVLDGEGRPRILDFGIARLETGNGSDRDARAGSRSTLAPEQVDPRRGPVTPRTDVYALGVIGFRLVTGEAPYDVGTTLASAAQAILHVPALDARIASPHLPPELARGFRRALAKPPGRRFPDGRALAAAFRRGGRPRWSRVPWYAAASLALLGPVGWSLSRTHRDPLPELPSPSVETNPPAHTIGETEMKDTTASTLAMFAALAGGGTIAAAQSGLPIWSPQHLIPLAGVPSDGAMTVCDTDVLYIRPGDRSLRVLRLGADGNWTDTAMPGQPTLIGQEHRVFGSGRFAAALRSSQSGADRIDLFERSYAGDWSFRQSISAPTGGSWAYPNYACWSGDAVLIGDRYADSYRGAAFIFRRQPNGVWTQEAKLQGSLATPTYTELWTAKLDGDLAVLGHWLSPCGYSAPSGRVYVFRRGGNGVWSQEAIIRPAWTSCGDGFGMYVGTVQGRVFNLNQSRSPWSVKTFERVGAAWEERPEFLMPEGLAGPCEIHGTSWGTLTLDGGTGAILATRLTAEGFVNSAIFRPTVPTAQSGYWWNLGSSDSICASWTRTSANASVISVYDLTPLLDCNNDGIPNADEIAAGAPDCNANGIPDSCEGSGEYVSPAKAPFGVGQAFVHTFTELPAAEADVVLTVEVKADLGGVSEFVTVRADGTSLGTLFGIDGQDCPAEAQVRTITIPTAQFNTLAADGAVTIELVPSSLVSVKECSSSTARVRLAYLEQLIDCDANGISDACQIATDPGLDKDGDGTLDGCNYAKGDFDLNDVVDAADLAYLLAIWGVTNPPVGDLNDDNVVNAQDLAILLGNWGPI